MANTESPKNTKTMREMAIEQGAQNRVFEVYIEGLQAMTPRKKRAGKGKWEIELVPDYRERQRSIKLLLKASKSNIFDLCSEETKDKVRKVLSQLEQMGPK